jgi:branched-chain amino acid transport system substrate-binding protein
MERHSAKIKTMLMSLTVAAGIAVTAMSAQAANEKLKIGFVGVTSGPAAAWGTSNVRSMQTRAAWINEIGGVKIGSKTYDIEIVTFDDQKDPMMVRPLSALLPNKRISSISHMLSRNHFTARQPQMLFLA